MNVTQKFLKLIVLFFILGNVAFAQVTQLNYKAKFGMFGTVGNIKNTLTQNAKTYQIKTRVTLSGMAKSILGGQTEEYISKGHMEHGLMVSDFYKMTTRKKETIITKEYTINHANKHITKKYEKWTRGKLVKEYTQKLNFYAKDDLLTLYFNLGKAIPKTGKTYKFRAVGLEKQQGKVEIVVPQKRQLKKYKKDLGEHATLYAKALIYQKNFRKKKGDILLAVGDDGFIKKAVIKDILLFGDAQLLRVK
ncbi:MAG: hypothetical protein DSZ08_05310 [Sulfurovum sp.]|nr:MAG: hypothetical protein DSZ08_05310 [Sulfurovum sp.]